MSRKAERAARRGNAVQAVWYMLGSKLRAERRQQAEALPRIYWRLMGRQIPITHGFEMIEVPLYGRNHELNVVVEYALIDDGDVDLLRYRWRLAVNGYAERRAHGKRLFMHRQILCQELKPGLETDHINRNKLDNRRANLRAVTLQQNRQNLGPQRRNAIGYRGVQLVHGKYRAVAYLNKQQFRLGVFADAAEANRVLVAWRREHMPYSTEG